MTFRVDLPTKLAGETKNYNQFDFSGDLAASETISTKVVTATVYSGVDPSPSSLVSGSASSTGAVVSQILTGGVLGVIYEILCTVTTSAGQTLERVGYLAVVPDLQ